jgi:squalene synthase HpnC
MNPSKPLEIATNELQQAYKWCEDFARSNNENFTVVSWLLPKELRSHFFSVYAFCRYTDDLGDEAEGDRKALLNAWEKEILSAIEAESSRPLTKALIQTINECAIPVELFLRLIEANRMDQHKQRFTDYEELLNYCSYSANPVGQMVLGILGHHDTERIELSDATCTGLQLANFWQDVSVDITKGRIYIPLEDLEQFGVTETDIHKKNVTHSYRDLMEFEVNRTRGWFQKGAALERMLSGNIRTDIRLFRQGGEAILDAIQNVQYDTLSSRPTIKNGRKAKLAVTNVIRGLLHL